MTRILIYCIIILILSCKPQDVAFKFCNDDLLLMVDNSSNLKLRQCINLDSLTSSKSKFGKYTIFSFECVPSVISNDVIVSISFDLSKEKNLLYANLLFLDVSSKNKEEFNLYVADQLNGLFGCFKELNPISNGTETIKEGESVTVKYKKLLFTLYKDEVKIIRVKIENI